MAIHNARMRSVSPFSLSSIRTVTVGFGITPNLLTSYPGWWDKSARGLEATCFLPPVGTSTPPRERVLTYDRTECLYRLGKALSVKKCCGQKSSPCKTMGHC